MWNNLRAALNLAYQERHVPTDAGWASVRAFRGTQVARIHFLNVAEQVRLVNVCPADFRLLVQAGLFTGAREAELTRLVAQDFDPENGSVFIEFSKNRKSRHVTLTTEGQAFFQELTAGLEPTAPLFPALGIRPEGQAQHRGVDPSGNDPDDAKGLRCGQDPAHGLP